MGHRDWGWLWFGHLLRLWLWLFRVRGGFVYHFHLFAFGVGFGRPARRRFRTSLMLVRAWCWSFAFGRGFGRVRWSRFIFSFGRILVLVDPGQKLGSLRNNLALFKQRSAYTTHGKWPGDRPPGRFGGVQADALHLATRAKPKGAS